MSLAAWERSLLKKLRQVDELRRKQQHGIALNEAQQHKVSLEAGLREELRSCLESQGRIVDGGKHIPAPGDWLIVLGRKAKLKRVEEGGRLRVRFKDDKSKAWVSTSQDIRIVRRSPAVPAAEGSHPSPPPTAQSTATAPASEQKIASPKTAVLKRNDSIDQRFGLAASASPSGVHCNHCGRPGHEARSCSFGLEPDELFLQCGACSPYGCAPRRFIVPLRRACSTFSPTDLRGDGRVDVGVRCLSSALFRSQSLRQNTQVSLCFGADAAPRILEVHGALVRDLRPDEASLGARLRLVSDAAGEALAERERAAARVGGAALEAWSRGQTRGLRSCAGDWMEALRRALTQQGTPPLLMLLRADGEFIGDVCAELRRSLTSAKDQADLGCGRSGGGDAGHTRTSALCSATSLQRGGVVVLLGDDRGLSEEEEAAVRQTAQAARAPIKHVSLGSDVLFASHAIVLVHHYLDRYLHSCRLRPPREYARGGGSGNKGRGRARGKGGGRGRALGKGSKLHGRVVYVPDANDNGKQCGRNGFDSR